MTDTAKSEAKRIAADLEDAANEVAALGLRRTAALIRAGGEQILDLVRDIERATKTSDAATTKKRGRPRKPAADGPKAVMVGAELLQRTEA